jgi:hypothetical protein
MIGEIATGEIEDIPTKPITSAGRFWTFGPVGIQIA